MSTESVFEDNIPDPFKARVFAIAVSEHLPVVGWCLLAGAALTASCVLVGKLMHDRSRPPPSQLTLAAVLALAVALLLAGWPGALVAGAVVVIQWSESHSPSGNASIRTTSCLGAAIAAVIGAWIVETAAALSVFASVGSRAVPDLATVFERWPSAWRFGSALALMVLPVAASLRGVQRRKELRFSVTSVALTTLLVLPGTCVTGWAMRSLDARATCHRLEDGPLADAIAIPTAGRIGECVPRKTITVSGSQLTIDDTVISLGQDCEHELRAVLSRRMGEHFILPKQDASVGDLGCALSALHSNRSTQGLWKRPGLHYPVGNFQGTSSAFVAFSRQDNAPTVVLHWSTLPLRIDFTIVEQLPNREIPVLRVVVDGWSWEHGGHSESLRGTVDERWLEARRLLSSTELVALAADPDVSADVLLTLAELAQQPPLVLITRPGPEQQSP